MSRRLRVPSKPNLASVSQDHPEGWPCYLTARTPYDKPQIRAGLRLETVRLHNELPYLLAILAKQLINHKRQPIVNTESHLSK